MIDHSCRVAFTSNCRLSSKRGTTTIACLIKAVLCTEVLKLDLEKIIRQNFDLKKLTDYFKLDYKTEVLSYIRLGCESQNVNWSSMVLNFLLIEAREDCCATQYSDRDFIVAFLENYFRAHKCLPGFITQDWHYSFVNIFISRIDLSDLS